MFNFAKQMTSNKNMKLTTCQQGGYNCFEGQNCSVFQKREWFLQIHFKCIQYV